MNTVFAFGFGVVLAMVGFNFTHWQFWLLMSLAAAWATYAGASK
jgi:hypothetical protein